MPDIDAGAPDIDAGLEALLAHLRDTRGFDFTGYKRSSLSRRVARRMQEVGITDHGEYIDHLEMHAEEFTALFNTILINVTAFFRDPDSWDHLQKEILPGLLATKRPGEQLRVWSAGCASGEEAYTLAIVLAELLGVEEFRSRVKIYATDVDEEALTHARQAVYDEQQVRNVPDEWRERYFERVGPRYQFRPDLRRSVIFGRNDLVQDAPISRIDLLVCRNTLMYLTAETQSRILSRFHFALGSTGVLFLGKAEMLLSHGALFVPLDLRRRVFTKVARVLPAGPVAPVGFAPPSVAGDPITGRTYEEMLLSGPVAQLVVTVDGTVALVNRAAEALLGVSVQDRGRPFRDLELSYRPVELRRYIEQAQSERRTVTLDDVRLGRRDGETVTLETAVSPLFDPDGAVLGVTVTFHDVTTARRLQDDLRRAHLQLETAYEELQSTNEELETTNEELQSTVEELETTNEELQSTNEELETMNEELHSTNDELQSINDELQDRTAQLNEANHFLESVLGGLRAGVVVLGPDLNVREWNRQAQELWGLRREEVVGQHFLALDIGLPLDRLQPMIREALSGRAGSQELGVAAVNRRGRSIGVRVLSSTLDGHPDAAPGIILMMEQDDAQPATQDAADPAS
ncbi:CheR family methyltransferase [Pseudonocardia broussonetiae]|uniref:CheR family methyltransferase n=1 Tax=Pseudonocardia broussonetiae TaxID=2736640 RepID=UPI001F03F4CC|nr:CheR family methyltransferase [Pseudonocardia broussonetiae]